MIFLLFFTVIFFVVLIAFIQELATKGLIFFVVEEKYEEFVKAIKIHFHW